MGSDETERLRRHLADLEAENTRLRAHAHARPRPDDSEERRLAIIESATDFAIIATDRDGQVTDWNTGAERILGWSAGEMLGRSAEVFFTPEDRAAGHVEAEMRESLATGRASDERWHLRKGGERFWASGEMQPLRDAAGRHLGFVKLLRDRTEQHRAGEALRSAEARLRESEDHYRHTVELSPQVAWTCDPEGSITSYSPRWLELTGQAPGEPLGAGWAGALHPDDLAHTMAVFSASLDSGEPVDVDYRIRHAATGEVRWVRARATPRRDEAGTIVRWYGVVEDVHDRKLAEAHLRESEARFRAFAQAMPNHVWSATPDGRLDWVNERALAYGGTRSEDSVGEGWTNRLHPNDVAVTQERWAAALASGEVYQTEFRLRRADGIYRWHLARAVPIHGADGAIERWVGTNTDIEDQKAAAEVLAREAEALGQEVAERRRERDRTWALSPVLKVVGTLAGDILAVNPSWTRTLGWTEADTLGRNVVEFMAPEDKAAGAAGMEHLASGGPTREFQSVLTTKDGGQRTIAWNTVREEDLLYGFGRDITEQRLAEEALRQSQKMEAVGQLTGGIAHDFNNMLAGILGALELTQRRIEQGRVYETRRYLDAATTSAQRAAGLTHRLLAFSRRQSLDMRSVDANALVAGMEDLLRRTLGESIALDTALAAGLWLASTDANQLESAVLNLAINARDAMPEGGRLTIETANAVLDETYTRGVEGLEPGNYVVLSVSDTGVGMSPEVLARAFDPFFTTKPIGQGTGLGLSMIHGFARQSGGHVRIYSHVDQGTTVKLYLPRAQEATAETGPQVERPRAEQGERVLVVEDDASVRLIVLDLLQELGYRAEEAHNAREALPILEGRSRIDLLITDVGLPGMNGRQLAEVARQTRPGLPVLFVTGYAEGAAVRGGFLDTDMDMVTKPFAMDTLASAIRGMIERGKAS